MCFVYVFDYHDFYIVYTWSKDWGDTLSTTWRTEDMLSMFIWICK